MSHVRRRRRRRAEHRRVARDLHVHARGHAGEADDQEGDVVARVDRGGDVRDDRRGQLVGVSRRGRTEDLGQQVDADVDAPAAALDEPVGVGDERRAGAERHVDLVDRLGLGEAEWRGAGAVEARHPSRSRRIRARADAPRRRT